MVSLQVTPLPIFFYRKLVSLPVNPSQVEMIPYREMLGVLMYLSLTRADLLLAL